MSRRKAVVTGMGLITSLGRDLGENWESLKAGGTGIARYERDGVPERMQYLGKVSSFEQPEGVPHKLQNQMRFLNRGARLGFVAAREAFDRSGLDIQTVAPNRRALFIASGDFTGVGYEFMRPGIKDAVNGDWSEIDFEKLNASTLAKVTPFFLLESISNNLFSFLSAFLGFMGPNTSLASLSPMGAGALELAARRIEEGEADTALAVGCGNWITEVPLYEMSGLGILSGCRFGERSYRPFDRRRDGFIPGEGGAALFLEAADAAERRGANILAELKGFGNRIAPPAGRGLSVPATVSLESMRAALDEADCREADTAMILPHGSGTRKGDRSELKSIVELLGDGAPRVPICGLKPCTGHMGAASDLAEVIFGIMAIAEGFVPGTLNFERADDEFSRLAVSNLPQPAEGRHFLSTSYGILGECLSVVVEVPQR